MTAEKSQRLISDMRGVRYGEVLAVMSRDEKLQADVYGTQMINDCPAELWDTLNADEIAKDMRAARLYDESYAQLKLDPVTLDAGQLFAGVELLSQLDQALSATENAAAPTNAVLDLSVFGEQDYQFYLHQPRDGERHGCLSGLVPAGARRSVAH